MKRNIRLKVAVLAVAFLLGGCAGPYKLLPGYEEHLGRMESIALYPLIFTDDGQDERLFGLFFSDNFFDSVAVMTTSRAIEFFTPESTVTLLQHAGRSVIDGQEITDTVKITSLTVVRRVNWDDLRAISEDVDGVVVCDLLNYHEVSWGDAVGGAIVRAGVSVCCGILGSMLGMKQSEESETSEKERNEVRMKFTMYETESGTPVWEYVAQYSKGTPGEQRMEFTQKLLTDFRKCFPLSATFKGK